MVDSQAGASVDAQADTQAGASAASSPLLPRNFYPPRPDDTPPAPPWTYPFHTAEQYAEEYAEKIQALEGGSIQANRNGGTPNWRSQQRLSDCHMTIKWGAARKSHFYACLDAEENRAAAIDKLNELFIQVGGAGANQTQLASAFRLFCERPGRNHG